MESLEFVKSIFFWTISFLEKLDLGNYVSHFGKFSFNPISQRALHLQLGLYITFLFK